MSSSSASLRGSLDERSDGRPGGEGDKALDAGRTSAAAEAVDGAAAGAADLAAVGAKPIQSMTGYARVSGRITEALGFSLALRSINHRFLDLQLRTPPGTEPLEPALRRELKAHLVRGHVECTLTLERTRSARGAGSAAAGQGSARPALAFDDAALGAFLAHFRATAAAHGLRSEPDLHQLARLPGLLVEGNAAPAPEPVAEPAPEDHLLEAAVVPRLREALGQLRAMRAGEGAALAAVLAANLDELAKHTEAVAELRSGAREAHLAHLRERLFALVGDAVAPERLLQEAALLAERGDVDEELARMRAHIGHFRALLAGGGEVGKKLDFLLQEMHREANTLLAKTTGTAGSAATVTVLGLAMKAEIEKAREQVQNLE